MNVKINESYKVKYKQCCQYIRNKWTIKSLEKEKLHAKSYKCYKIGLHSLTQWTELRKGRGKNRNKDFLNYS